ncbi:MAG: hypothetical protein V3T08_10290, partial [Gemmatimonadota bacterium]
MQRLDSELGTGARLPHGARGFVHKRLIGAATGFLTGGPGGAVAGFAAGGGGRPSRRSLGAARGATRRVILAERRQLADSGGGCSHLGSGFTASAGPNSPCVAVAQQVVRTPGVRGVIERALPFGATGFEVAGAVDRFGEAVVGAFGMPALEPAIVGEVERADGSVGLIRRCPSGLVLGRDELCYPREILRRNSRFRKWRPGVKPILTSGQRSSIRKAKVAIVTARDAISGLGVSVTKK